MGTQEIEFTLPGKIERYLALLSKLYAHKSETELQKIVVNASVKVDEGSDYDNWDGGTYGHDVHLELPEVLYFSVIDEKNAIQERIRTDLNTVSSSVPREYFSSVYLEYQFTPLSDWRSESGLLIRPSQTGKIGPSKTLEGKIRAKDIGSVEQEYIRAMDSLAKDPPASLTAACAIIESICRHYIEEHGLQQPKETSIKPLWSVVSKHLNLDPGRIEDEDLKRILSGMFSIIDGIGALRTHAGSAHGRGKFRYNIQPRHARLAVHASHTLAVYLFEGWDDKGASHS